MPPERLRVPSGNTSSASPLPSRSSAVSIVWRAAFATSRAFMAAPPLDTPSFCGDLMVPKHRLEKRRVRSE